MLARARGVPLVTGLDGDPADPVDEAVLDAHAGLLVTSPVEATRSSYARRLVEADGERQLAQAALHKPAVTAGGERIEVMINVDDPAAVPDEVLAACDGVGLMRTEFLFLGRDRSPTEDEQYAAYTALLDKLDGKPAIIRTLDIGGDKPLPHLGIEAEANPFLGLRGIRLCLARPELFKPQVRALLRAAPGRALRVMLPMVATAGEIAQTRDIFESCLAELKREGKTAAMPPLGIMVETPAAAIAIDQLDADFYSIGSNDLTQYVMAAARDASGPVAALNDPRHPAVVRLIAQVVRHGLDSGKPVSLCGDMASDTGLLAILLAGGLAQDLGGAGGAGPGEAGAVQARRRPWLTWTPPTAPTRSRATRRCCAPSSSAGPQDCAAGWRWRWASIRASFPRSPTPPTPCRSRRPT